MDNETVIRTGQPAKAVLEKGPPQMLPAPAPALAPAPRRRRQVALLTGAVVQVALAVAGCGASSTSTEAETSVAPSAAGVDSQPAGSLVEPVQPNKEAIAKLPEAFKSKGEIVVALTEQTPPSGFVSKTGVGVVGVDADFAVLLSEALGLKLTPAGTSFDQIIPGIAAGKYDMTIAAMSPTADRMKVLDFVDYFRTGTNIGVPKGNPMNLTLNTLCGKKVAVLKGSVQEGKIAPALSTQCTASGKDPIQLSSFPDQQTTVLAVVSGRVDAAVQSAPPLAYAKKQGANIDIAKQDSWTTVALGVKKDSGLLDAVHLATQGILTSPAYKQLLDKWGVADNAVNDAKVNNVTY